MMKKNRGILPFISILVVLWCATLLVFDPLVKDCSEILKHGWGTTEYTAVGIGQDGTLCAAAEDNGRIQLTLMKESGKRVGTWRLKVPGTAFEVEKVRPLDEKSVFVSGYAENGQNWKLLRIDGRSKITEMLSIPCEGGRDSVELLSFTEERAFLGFAVRAKEEVNGFTYDFESGTMVRTEKKELPEGKTASVGLDGALRLMDKGVMTAPCQVDGTFYYVDATNLIEWQQPGAEPLQLQALYGTIRQKTVTSLSLGRRGALLLLDGHELYLMDQEQTHNVTGGLYRGRIASMVILCVLRLGAVLLTLILWYLVCGKNSGWMTMSLRWGSLLLAVSLAAWIVVRDQTMRPAMEQAVVTQYLSAAENQAEAVFSGGTASADGEFGEQNAYILARQGKDWMVEKDATFAVLLSGFSHELAEKAEADGSAGQVRNGWMSFVKFREGKMIFLRAKLGGELPLGQLERSIAIGWCGVTVSALLIVFLISFRTKRLSRALDALASGESEDTPELATGDETEDISRNLKGFSEAIKHHYDQQEDLIQAYRRFVPERVLMLLEKTSVAEVTKQTCTSREMSVMMVRFTFGNQLYRDSSNSYLLFDSFNQVIERTASIAAAKDGTAFNFAYDGFDVVMPQERQELVSTAVMMQQEVLAFNEQREKLGLPKVRFHIALDVGNVIMGIVGDNDHYEPTAISSSFATVRDLIGLCDVLDANILCTEQVIGQASGYGSRYLGKTYQTETPVRVYEVFEGDPYEMRKSKVITLSRFSQGVFCLSCGELAEAKRIFLKLAHDNPLDGSIRYYLYLADRMEQGIQTRCELAQVEGRKGQWN